MKKTILYLAAGFCIITGALAQPPAKVRSTADVEDLTKLSVAGSNLHILGATAGERDDYPTFTREMIELSWRIDDPIYLFLILPKGVTKPPVIIYLYSFPTDTDRFMNDNFCALLAKDGVAAAGFVSALTGHRYHDRPMKEWFISELPEALGKSVHDVQMVLNYLETRADVDATRAGFFGDGSGGTIGILTASVEPRLKAVDLVNPWGDWPAWFQKSTLIPEDERAVYVKPDFLKRADPYDPVHALGSIKVPVRLQYMGDPGPTPLDAAQHMEAAAAPGTMVIARDEALAAYRADKSKFFDWIKSQVRELPSK